MKIKIASMLLGEDVKSILDKIQLHQDETSDYQSRLKKLLLRKQELNQQFSDLEKQKKDCDRQIAALRNDVDEKQPLRKVAEQIIQTEKDIISKEKEICDCSSKIIESQQSVIPLQKEIDDLKSRKSLLETEKRKYEGEIDNEDTVSDELQVVNSEIVNLQEWLRIHSADLTKLESEMTELIHALEDDKPIETPQEDIKEDGEEAEKESKDDTTNEKPNDKKEPDEGKRNKTVEPPTRKKRDHKIKEVFDIETGDTIYAEEFFKKPIDELQRWRTIFQQCISQDNRRFVCPKCLEMIRISGRGDERGVPAIFTHKNDSISCKRTTTGQSVEDINRKKYGLFGQSQRHKDLKQELYNCLCDRNSLSLGVSNVEMEKRVYSTLPFFSWRQPDIQIAYQGHKIVFEIQLSTTFLSVITERDTFYRLNDYYIIWIFNFDDNRKYVDLNNLAMKDIYFANKRNAFIFDDEARKWSRESRQLVLKCNWVDPDSTWHYANTEKRFGGERVTLDKLKFDHDTNKLYYFDAETPYFDQHSDIKQRLAAELKSKEEYIRNYEQKAQEKEIRRQDAIGQMMIEGGHVIPFKEGRHYGFKYGTTTIIEPHFTSCVPREDGTFIVGFFKKEGLVSQYGEMIRECEYIKIHPLSGSAYIAEDRDSFWLGNINRMFRERRAGDRANSVPMTKRIEKVNLFHKNEDKPFSSFYVLDGRKFFVRMRHCTTLVDLEGNKIVDEEFSKMRLVLDHNLMHVQRNEDGKWNDLDFDGNYISDWTIYEDIKEWGEGLRIGKVHIEGNWRRPERTYFDIIDAEGSIITGGLSYIGELYKGKAKVVIEGKNAEIDAKGHLVPEIEIQLTDNIKASKLLGYWQLVNQEGKTILSRKDRIVEIVKCNRIFDILHEAEKCDNVLKIIYRDKNGVPKTFHTEGHIDFPHNKESFTAYCRELKKSVKFQTDRIIDVERIWCRIEEDDIVKEDGVYAFFCIGDNQFVYELHIMHTGERLWKFFEGKYAHYQGYNPVRPLAFHFIHFYKFSTTDWVNDARTENTINNKVGCVFAYQKNGEIKYGTSYSNMRQPDHLTLFHKDDEYWDNRRTYFNDIEMLGFHYFVGWNCGSIWWLTRNDRENVD